MEKVAQNGGLFMPKVSNRSLGENSPNLATLLFNDFSEMVYSPSLGAAQWGEMREKGISSRAK
jgi:hypothetical protein